MLSTIAGWAGQVIGETVHQADRALGAAWDGTKAVAEDVMDIPSAFAQGYEDELFESTPTTETTNTSADVEVTVTEPYNEYKANTN